jgi:UDP-N-acetylmuramoyl-L-alanyl-D-glutamate--2,6-diaminopimelate ligase
VAEQADPAPAAAVPLLAVAGLPALLGALAALYYRDPTAQLTTIGVTGTNGKTSCSHWIAQLLSACGQRCAVVGTVGSGFAPQLAESPLTTPDAVSLQAQARRFLDQGAAALAMEVSSIGLDQGRVDGMRFDHALFTNLTRDHLDYHGSMAEYERAKTRLFERPTLTHAVLNLDDECGRRLAQRCASRGIRTTGYRLNALPGPAAVECEISGGAIELGAQGIRFDAHLRGSDGLDRTLPVSAPVIGRFNVSNLLGVLGIALAAGIEARAAAAALSGLQAPPGRLQRVPGGEGDPLVLVDYAHTPDAIAQALAAVRPVAQARGGRVWIVFGAGGDRDPGKRPQMGAAALAGADRVVVTSDNPRGEDPGRIIDQVLQGAGGAGGRVARCADRAGAIALALDGAGAADVVLIAGKGHENYQEIAGRRTPFSDADCARALLQRPPRSPAPAGPR